LAQLHFDSLIDKTKPRDISQALENLPKGSEALSTAYQEALDRIDSQQPGFRKLAQQVLAWTTYSQRPLTVGELQHALAVEVGTTEIDAENDLEEFSEMVSVCAGLVTIDPESNVIRLVHHTAQNFLEQVREDWLADAQTKIAESCLAYLSLETLADGWCLNDTLFETKLNQNVFLDYAAKYWGTHASHKREPRTKNLALSFLNKEGNTSSAHQVMFSPAYRYSGYSQGGPQKLSAMHLLAHFGLENIASAHLNHGYDPDLRDTDGRTPLSWAAQNGAESVVKLLITRDDVVADSKDNKDRTPLLWAAGYGHKKVAELLLSRNDVIADLKDQYSRTPLLWAAGNGHDVVVQLLLTRNDIVADSKDNNGQTPLLWAARKGAEAVVKLLLARDDVIVNSKDVYGRTPLSWAAGNRHDVIVKLLLTRNDTIADSKDNNGQTPLSWAAENGAEAALKLLLARDDVVADSKDKYGRTPLLWAAENGHEILVKLLLARDDVIANSKDEYGRTPLLWAAEN
jgi:ankyrin repeat protein